MSKLTPGKAAVELAKIVGRVQGRLGRKVTDDEMLALCTGYAGGVVAGVELVLDASGIEHDTDMDRMVQAAMDCVQDALMRPEAEA